MPKNYCIMQIWAESGKSALPICNYSQILYQFLTFTQNLKRSLLYSGNSPRILPDLTDNLSGVCICTGKIRCEDPVGIRIGLCIRCIAAVSADWSV